MRTPRPALPLLALPLLALLARSPALAQTPAPSPAPAAAPGADAHKVTVLGLGLTTCETWTQMRGVDAGNMAEQWMLGFLSGGAAFGASNYLGATGLLDVLKLAANYCTSNPHAPLAVATLEVAKELEAPMGRAAVHP